MGIFDIDEKKLQALYHRAWLECGRGFVHSRQFDYLDHALTKFAIENHCSYDEAYILAKTGKKTGRLADR